MKPTRTPFMQRIQIAYRKALEDRIKRKETGPEPTLNGVGRREFIMTTALAAAALTIPFSCRSKTGKTHSVAIIGGGIAGLNAANVLLKLGITATIYEASDRAGGRIFTQYMDNGLTRELGAEFIDSNHYDMLSLADEFELELMDCALDNHDNGLDEHFFYYGKKRRTEKDIIDEFKKVKDVIETDKNDYETHKNVSLADYLKKLGVQGWFYDLLYWGFTAEFGLPAEEQTSLNFIDMINTDTSEGFKIFGDSDERFKIKGGNSALIKALEQKLKNQIRFKSKLTALKKSGDSYQLTFEGAEPVTADYVLLTLPFTMLRNVQVDAGFPETKNRIIKELGYGTNSKLLFEMSDRIWRSRKSSGYLFNEIIQNGWDNSQLQKENKGEGGYTVFLGGKAGHELKKDPADFEKYIPAFMGAFNVKPGSIVIKQDPDVFNWSSHKYTGGSYACYKTGQWDLAKEMMQPAGNVFFAGEHCSEKCQGFMNGGAETGRVAAEALVAKIFAEMEK